MSYPYGYGGVPYGYGGGYGLNPYAYLQQLQQQMGGGGMPPQAPQQQPMPFNQWAQQQPYPSGKLQPYGPFVNPQSPASLYRMQQLQQMYQQQAPMQTAPMPGGTAAPAAGANPSIGLSNIVRQMQGGMSPIAARQQLAGLAGVPQMGPGIGGAQPQFRLPPHVGTWSSQQPAMTPARNFSPLANEGYHQPAAPPPTLPNQFSAQNQTRGMGGGMNSGRPIFRPAVAGTGHFRP